VDSGTSWGFADPSFVGKNCGENQVFSYTIPDSTLFWYSYHDINGDWHNNGHKRPVEGSRCMIRLRAYHPGGPEVYSSVFGINQEPAVSAPVRNGPAARVVPLSARLATSAHATALSLSAPRAGLGRVLDVQGRTVCRFAVENGAQSISLPHMRVGCYLVEVRYAAGGHETVVAHVMR
jgi:hypothetical protein